MPLSGCLFNKFLHKMKMKRLLYEISIIRPFVILLIVIYHALCIYGGQWQAVNDVEIPLYALLTKVISGIHLEAFAMISGYIFAYQIIEQKRDYNFKAFALAKFKRLIIPCLFFGIIYYFMFYHVQGDFKPMDFLYKVTNGPGHLWFLPMLFWCLLGCYVICERSINEKLGFVVLLFCSTLPIPSLPLGLTTVPHFMLYLYSGFLLYKYKDKIWMSWMKSRYISVLFFVYGCLVLIWFYLIHPITLFGGIIDKIINQYITNLFDVFVALVGLMAMYLTVCKYINKPHFVLSKSVINLSSICFGIYIYHQFILILLYSKSDLPLLVNPYLLPWVAVAVTLVLSVLLTRLTLKARFGRFLIG